MDDAVKAPLFDIQKAIEEIDFFFQDRSKNFFDYKSDILLKRAVERDLEIIGEAMNRLLKLDESFKSKISDAVKIVGLRNQVIHAYDNLSDEIIWSIITNHLPTLKKEVETLVNNLNSPNS